MSAVVTFYRFVGLSDLESLRSSLFDSAAGLALKGTILLAEEGINGTLTGEPVGLEAFRQILVSREPFADMVFKRSTASADNPVFFRLKVRIKPEIVSFRQPGLDPARRTGQRVDAERWNQLLDDPDVLVIDTRNSYEIDIGTFPGAVNPQTRSFREFPQYVRQEIDPGRHPRVAMFCTGGIRCEKATAFMLEQGFDSVYQLDGGILGYLETVSPRDNRWQGECFVFDQRVSVDAALAEGGYRQCYACRRPLSDADLVSADYREGISCPHCVDEQSPARRAGFAERHHQVQLAEARGEQHLGRPQGQLQDGGVSRGSR
jgi:UPF0176 protein